MLKLVQSYRDFRDAGLIGYNERCVYFYHSTAQIIQNNYFNNTYYDAITIGSSPKRNYIIGNNIQNSKGYAISSYFYGALNTLNGNNDGYGIFVFKNQIMNNEKGICIVYDGSNISQNIISNNNGTGITCACGSIIADNIISNNNGDGIELLGLWCSIENNTIVNNNNSGIFTQAHVYSPWTRSNHIIKNNSIIMNREYGMFLDQSSYNVISSNNFILNKKNAYFEFCKNNTWNNNYWGRPRILPYPILGQIKYNGRIITWFNIDWHPALKPYDIS